MVKRNKKPKVKWITHYNSNQKTLLVGEGDFAFSYCLATAFGFAPNIVATFLDSKRTLRTKHWTSQTHLHNSEDRGCLVLHGANVHDMSRHRILSRMRFDVIIFNFPHAGHSSPLREHDSMLIERHQNLFEGFFKNAREMLSEEEEVHVTHRDDSPYSKWNLGKIAETSGYILKEKVESLKEDYHGYHNKRGCGIKSNKKFPIKEGFTFKFSMEKNFSSA